MIVDACLFAGEMEMLELRLRTLAPVVDQFVVVACTLTHQGEPAEVAAIHDAWYEAWSRVRPPQAWLHWVKPSRVMMRDGVLLERAPEERGPAGSPWFQHVEKQHRDGVRTAVREHASDVDTIVMVSDVDEVPDPAVVVRFRSWPGTAEWKDRCLVLAQRFHSTALDLLHPQQPWLGTTVSRLASCRPQSQRDARGTIDGPAPLVALMERGGWHFSWFGTDAERQRKLETFSHAELLPTFDPAAARVAYEHSNGEQLRRISAKESFDMDWPLPIVDGSMVLPDWWFTDEALGEEIRRGDSNA